MSIAIAKQSFDGEMSSARALILEGNSLVREKHITAGQQLDMVEFAFLKASIAWERLLEDCFLEYTLGGSDLAGHSPTRYLFPCSRPHAVSVINEGRDFIEWLNCENIRRLATNYFSNGWHITMCLNNEVFAKWRVLRNRIVHSSMLAEEKFRDLIRQECGSVPTPMIRPGQFLLDRKNQRRPQYYKVYFGQIEGAAKVLVGQ